MDIEKLAREAAEKAVPECLSRTCFIKGCGYDHCWGCDDQKAERERIAAIIKSVFQAENDSGNVDTSTWNALTSARAAVTVTVQDVANRLHQDMYGEESEHLALHSCPCSNFARWYLGIDPKPRMYWPDGKGGNVWDKRNTSARDTGTPTVE